MSITDIIPSDTIADREVLYRSVWQQPQYLVKVSDGDLRVSSAAFADDGNEISLFRHDLCESPPSSNPPKVRETDFVVSLLASRIRQQQISIGDKGEVLTIDVRPDTAGGQHVSHAVVYPNRTVGKKVFRKVKKRMSEIVEEDWPIRPDADFVASLETRTVEPE